jgi:TrmH family RNA methyltransferase
MITSLRNPHVQRIRSLRARKAREHTGLCFVEGIYLVAAAVQLQADIQMVVVAPQLVRSRFGHAIVQMACRRGIPCLEVTPAVFASFAVKDGAQGIGAVVRQRWHVLEHMSPVDDLCWVVLDAVQYPGNLGTILRTCDAVGGAGLVMIGPATDPYDPAAVRASMGAVFSQRLVRASREELAAWKRRLRGFAKTVEVYAYFNNDWALALSRENFERYLRFARSM